MLRNLSRRFRNLSVRRRWEIGAASLAVLILIGASFYFVYPYGEICRQAENANHKDCASYHLLFVGLWHLNILLTDYAAAITALATIAIAAFTATLWWVTRGTLKHLSREFETEHRPWVTLACRLAGRLNRTGDVWNVEIKFRVKNVGRSPATNVAFWTSIIPYSDMVNIREEIEKVCLIPEFITRDGNGGGTILFPREARTRERVVNGEPSRFAIWKNGPDRNAGRFLVLTCATYGATFDNARHRTAKAFLLYKLGGGDINPAGESLAVEGLGFSPTWNHAD